MVVGVVKCLKCDVLVGVVKCLKCDVLVGVVKCLKCDVLVGVVKCLKCDVLVGVVKCLKWSLDHTLQLKKVLPRVISPGLKVLHYATTMARTWLLGWLGHDC